MSELKQLIKKQNKDISGSRTFNRLTIQVSYAIQLLIDLFHADDFVVFMDYIDDVCVLKTTGDKELITTYKIKTKKEGGNFTLNFAIKEKWFLKMFKNKQFYGDYIESLNLVSNVNIKNEVAIFILDKANIETNTINNVDKNGEVRSNNLLKIKQAIAKEEKIDVSEVDLSDFYFIKTDLHVDCHKPLALQKFAEFVSAINSNAEYTTIKAFFTTLYSLLEDRFSKETDPNNDDISEIVNQKGYTKKQFTDSLQKYLNISIPTNNILFQYFDITKPKERKIISDARTKFLMDWSSNGEIFKVFLKEVDAFIYNNQDIENYQEFIDKAFNTLITNKTISSIFKDEGYIKFSLLFRLYTHINGVKYE